MVASAHGQFQHQLRFSCERSSARSRFSVQRMTTKGYKMGITFLTWPANDQKMVIFNVFSLASTQHHTTSHNYLCNSWTLSHYVWFRHLYIDYASNVWRSFDICMSFGNFYLHVFLKPFMFVGFGDKNDSLQRHQPKLLDRLSSEKLRPAAGADGSCEHYRLQSTETESRPRIVYFDLGDLGVRSSCVI